ncbi:MAG TPA: hypothetical protein VMH27_16530 [Puia sp.]|nr:hypothetical protein [Puia sp.]
MGPNVRLSAEELRLVSDPAWILTKNSIIRKVVELFGELSGEWREMGVVAGRGSEPRISRGEQHKGLPWVMLDYPRVFGKEDVLAVRTMFWWGHYFSITMHLKGTHLRTYLPVILSKRGELERAGFGPGTSEDEWEHEHQPGEWEIADRRFLKVSAKIGFDQWDQAAEILTDKFIVLARILIT